MGDAVIRWAGCVRVKWAPARWAFAAVACAFALALCSQPMLAKKHAAPTRTIEGAVFDAADNPVSGAEVDLADLTSGKKTAIYSMDKGQYSFNGLDLHHDFQVQAKFNGAASEARKVSFLEPRNDVIINLHLPPAKK
jgi:carboxypeptidase family protein